ncbi:hypothetical protein BH10BAC5_BH10BAC5_01720 [soil metagenome]
MLISLLNFNILFSFTMFDMFSPFHLAFKYVNPIKKNISNPAILNLLIRGAPG